MSLNSLNHSKCCYIASNMFQSFGIRGWKYPLDLMTEAVKSKEVQEQLGEQRFKSQKMQDEAHDQNAGGSMWILHDNYSDMS